MSVECSDLAHADSALTHDRISNRTAQQFTTIAVTKLRRLPRAAEIYGTFHEEEDSLLESVKVQGILTPLLVTTDGLVVAGHERLRVAQELGIEEVPVHVLAISEPNEIEEILINSNVARQKTNEQRIREYEALKRIEAAKATVRQRAGMNLMEKFPSGLGTGAARDLAAAKIGWSGRTAEKGAQVLDAADARAESGANMPDVQELRSILNDESIDAAHKKAVELGWIAGNARAAKKSRENAVRIARVAYNEAKAAAGKLVGIVSGKTIAEFTPEEVSELRKTLEPLMDWFGRQPAVTTIPQ